MEASFQFANVTTEEREKWFSEILQDFYTNNLHALPIQEGNINYRRVFMDSRSVMEIIQHLALNQQQTSQQLSNLNHTVGMVNHSLQMLMPSIQQLFGSLLQELADTKQVRLVVNKYNTKRICISNSQIYFVASCIYHSQIYTEIRKCT